MMHHNGTVEDDGNGSHSEDNADDDEIFDDVDHEGDEMDVNNLGSDDDNDDDDVQALYSPHTSPRVEYQIVKATGQTWLES